MIDWDSLEKKLPSPEPELMPLDGPETIFSGVACRLMVRSCADESRRDKDITRRLYKLACLLADAGAEGVTYAETDGFKRLITGVESDRPVYARGTDSRSVVTALGRALLASNASVLASAQKLGVRALLEW